MLTKLLIFSIILWLSLSDKNIMANEMTKSIKCIDLKCVRSNIDEINIQILNLLALRMNYVLQAGDIKLKNKIYTATDEKRANEVIKQVKSKANIYNLPDDYVEKLFKIIVFDSTKIEQNYMSNKVNH